MNRTLNWILLVVSSLLMVAGWILPLLTLKVSIEVPLLGQQTILDETKSLLGTIQKLSKDGNIFPALLITFFGVLVPLVKTVSLFYALLNLKHSRTVARWMFNINKWAMADVFCMSIIIALLTAKSLGNIEATPRVGFYVFTSYVILSGVAAQLSLRQQKQTVR